MKSIGALYGEDFEAAERFSARMSSAVAEDRVRLGLPPHLGGRQPQEMAPCGCAYPDIVDDNGVAICARCTEE